MMKAITGPYHHTFPSRRITAILCILATTSITASAQTTETGRFEQRSFYPRIRNGWTSSHGYDSEANSDAGWQTFEDFSFSSDEHISRFRWWGYYRDYFNPENNPVTPNILDWTITIWADNNGKPGVRLYSQTFAVRDVQSEQIALVDYMGKGLVNYLRFEVSFAQAFDAEAGKRYWISPSARMPVMNPGFSWSPGVPDRQEGHQIYTGSGMSWQAPVGAYANWGIPAEAVLGDRAMALIGHPANDLDADGMDDAWERTHGLDPNLADGEEDPDADGAGNRREFELQSDPHDPDTDHDGLPDGVETNDGRYLDALHTGTSPLRADTDGDGLADHLEVPGSDALGEDGPHDTDPNQADTDFDGYDDAIELANGFDPRDPASQPSLQVVASLEGGDLTDPEDDGNPNSNIGYDATFSASRVASFTGEGAFNVFDNRLGAFGDDGFGIEPAAFPWTDWVRVDLDVPHVLTHFTIASESSFSDGSWDPHIWAIEGSNDGGQTWDVIFLRVDGDQSVWTARSQVVRFEAGLHYPTPPAYRSFRFFNERVLELWGLRLGELELFGQPHQCRITGVRREQDGAINLEWTSIPGVTYVIEESVDLQTWREMVPPCPSGGAQSSYRIAASAEATPDTRFFRVREQ